MMGDGDPSNPNPKLWLLTSLCQGRATSQWGPLGPFFKGANCKIRQRRTQRPAESGLGRSRLQYESELADTGDKRPSFSAAQGTFCHGKSFTWHRRGSPSASEKGQVKRQFATCLHAGVSKYMSLLLPGSTFHRQRLNQVPLSCKLPRIPPGTRPTLWVSQASTSCVFTEAPRVCFPSYNQTGLGALKWPRKKGSGMQGRWHEKSVSCPGLACGRSPEFQEADTEVGRHHIIQ